jgi:hypothetical protein
MVLSNEAYRELAAIVGERYISAKQHILAGNRVRTPEIPFDYHSAAAILLPGSTEEVAAIVKVCNKYGISFIPFVSGVLPDAYANRAGTVLIHLKRMNRILEINEEDRYAVIEPGVRHIQLYPEVRKRGLSYTAAAVGPGGSVLANFTSTSGDHHTQYGTSRANRYLLAVEMVTPEGEIIRTGSLISGCGWFCPDGPGPGLRSIVRGYYGAHGQLGIITKAAIGLDPCKGPAEYRVEGISPHHRVIFDSDLSRVFVFNYDNIRNVCDAILALGEAEVGSTVQKYFYLPLTLMMTDSANDFWKKWTGGYKEALSMPLVVHLAARSVREREYEEKILFDVARETGGKRLPEELENWWTEHMDYFMVVSRLQSVLRLGGSWMPLKLGAESVQHICDVGQSIGEYIYEFTETGKIFDAPENYQIIPMEYGHFAHIELLYMWDRTNPASLKGAGEFRARSREEDLRRHFHAEELGCLNAVMEQLGPLYSNCHVWMRKIKESFDPQNVANPML